MDGEETRKPVQQLLSKSVTRREFIGTVVAALAVTGVGTACSSAPAATSTPAAGSATTPVAAAATAAISKGGKMVAAVDKLPSGLDPHVNVAWEVLEMLSNVYDTLVYMDLDGKIVPGLATSWDISSDGLTYAFHLRKDVKFHDGTPFNADAVKFSLDRMVAPETKSQSASTLISGYASADVVDDYTVKVTLKQPNAYLLQGMSMTYVAMVSPTAVKKWGTDYQNHQVGTGPFMMSESVPNQNVTMKPNPDYKWAPSFFGHQGPAYLQELTWKYLPEPSTRMPALQAGDVDLALDIPAIDGSKLKTSDQFSLMISRLTGQPLYWELNITNAPTDDLKVRQAILYAVDRKSVVNTVFMGLYYPAYGPLSAVTPEYDKSVESMYPYDPNKAKALLAEAGWKDTNGDGILEKDGQPLTLSMVIQSWGYIQPVAAIVQAQLKQVGINAKTEMLTYPAQMAAGAKGDRNMTVMGGSGFFAFDSLSGFFKSTNADKGFNWSKIKNKDLDALLDEGMRTSDAAKRNQIYAKAQEFIMQQALILPIYDYSLLSAVNKKIKDVKWSKIGLTPFLYDAYVAS